MSRGTVIRILGDEDHDYSFAKLHAVLGALGMTIDLDETPAEEFRDQIATEKAERIVALTQGNVALEAQAIPQQSARAQVEKAKLRIVASNRKLWAP